MPSNKITKKQSKFINLAFRFIMRHTAILEEEFYTGITAKYSKDILLFIANNHNEIRKHIMQLDIDNDLINFEEQIVNLIIKSF